jgi:lipopolysaccharide export system permease protein
MIGQFFKTFFFAIFALCVVFVIVDLIENVDDFIDSNSGFGVIVKYYIYYLPSIIKLLTPVATLLAALFTVGRLSTSSEIVAMKSGGVSLYRILMPFLVVGILISIFQVYFCGWIVPKSVQGKNVIEAVNLKRGTNTGPIYDLYFRESPNRNLILMYYNPETYLGNQAALETYSQSKHPRMLKRIESQGIRWDTKKNKWLMTNVIIRDYTNNQIHFSKQDTMQLEMSLTHNQLITLKKKTDEMNYFELKQYIDLLQKGGKDVRKQLVEYHGNYAYPFASIVVVLFGVPFASVKRRGGMAVQIGAALLVSFIYILSTKFSQTIGYASGWNPIIAGWLANIIFAVIGLFVIFRTKT